MNYLQQFEKMLTGLSDENEAKSELLKAFGNVQEDFNDAILKRDTAKKNFNEYKTNLTALMGSDDLDKIESSVSELKANANSEDIEKLKADLEAKYSSESDELRNMLNAKETEFETLQSQHKEQLFSNEIRQKGLLNGFNVANPKVEQMILDEYKSKLLVEDGQVFVNDGNGGKAKDVKSGEFFGADFVKEQMLSSEEWLPFVAKQTNGNGGGTPPASTTNTPTPSGGTNRSKMTASEKGEYIKEHGQEAYLGLPN